MMIFFALNGMGIVFLIYVLVLFWKEGRRPVNAGRREQRSLPRDPNRATLVLVNRPLTFKGGKPIEHSVIQFKSVHGLPQEEQSGEDSFEKDERAPGK